MASSVPKLHVAAVCLQLLLCAAYVSAFFWQCPPCEYIPCKPVHCREELQTLDPACGCCPVCMSGELGRCGGSSNVQCAGHNLVCKYRLGNMMGEDRTGVCENVRCQRKVCGYRQYCSTLWVEDHYVVDCRCPKYYNDCEGKYNPVCGNNGVTYDSLCHLQKKECKDGTFIGVLHMGHCEELDPDTIPVSVPPTFSLKTNRPPSEEDSIIFQQLYLPDQGAPESFPSGSCVYHGKKFVPNTITQIDPKDPCRYLVCNPYNVLSVVPVPGCPGNPPDIDPGILKRPVPGGWSKWSDWTVCEGGCYNSTHTQDRECNNPKPKSEGPPCEGSSEQTRKCFPERCNISCDYTQWSKWSKCSVTCGGGVTIRTRSITNNLDEEVKRKACDLVESRECGTRACPTGQCSVRSLGTNPEDLDYLPVLRNGVECHTTTKQEVFYCGGECPNTTQCCKAIAHKNKRNKQVDCGYPYYVQADIPVVKKCACVVNEDDDDGSADLGV